MLENFLPISRDLRSHWIYSDSQYLHIWLEILFSARYAVEPHKDIYKGVIYEIKRGEFLFSRPSYAERLKISESKVRKCIDDLKRDKMIEQVNSLGKNRPTIYKVINYDVYNPLKSPSETQIQQGIEEEPTKLKPTENQLKTKSQPLKKKDNTEKTDNLISIEKVNEIWQMYPSKTGTAKAKQKLPLLIKTYGEEQIKRCIERYKKNKQDWRQWQNGSTFFNTGYIDYLDSNFSRNDLEKNIFESGELLPGGGVML